MRDEEFGRQLLCGMRVFERLAASSCETTRLAVGFAGMLAAEMGAEVLRVEAERPNRHSGARERFLLHRKLSVAEDHPAGEGLLLTDDPACAERWSGGPTVLVLAGQVDGAPAATTDELTIQARTGLLDIFAGNDGRPRPLPGRQIAYATGAAAFDALVAAHLATLRGRQAVSSTVGAEDVALWINWKHYLAAIRDEQDAVGIGRAEDWHALRCKDGYLAITFQDKDMSGLAALTGNDLFLSPEFRTRKKRSRNVRAINEAIEHWAREHTRAQAVELAQSLRIPSGPVLEPMELGSDPQMIQRKFLTDVVAGGTRPRVPVLFTASGTVRRSMVRVIEDRVREAALKGLRVLDFGIITAGASTSAMLADLGAEVIKVEGPDYIDPFRTWVGQSDSDDWWNDSPHFAFTNRNKRSLCVDLKTPAGKELILRLVERCDIVVENFRSGVLERLGFGFEVLRSLRSDLVMASISSQGATGPQASTVSFGSTLEASGGLSSMIRTSDGVPLISGHALNYPDQVVSLISVGMILAALVERERTGRGVHLDLSQRETAAFLIGEYLSTDATTPCERADDISMVSDVVRCLDSRWVAVSIPDSSAAARVAACTGADPRQPIEGIAQWSLSMHAPEVVQKLRSCGVLAQVCNRASDLLEPGIAGSIAFGRDAGGKPVKGLPWKIGERVSVPPPPMANLGADNRYVACDILGLGLAEVIELERSGVLAQAPRAKRGQR